MIDLNLAQYKKKYIEILFILLPISLVFSSVISELIIFLLLIFYLKLSNTTDIIHSLKKPIIFLLCIFWIYLIINYFINFDKGPSILRTIFFIRFIILIIATNYFINYLEINLNKIYKFWLYFILFICLDLFWQFFFKKNIIGYESSPAGNNTFRLGGMMGEELKIAYFIFYFGIIVFSFYIVRNIKNKTYSLFFLIFLLNTVFITGERSNLISLFFFTVLVFFCFKFNKKIYFLIFTIIFSTLLILNISNKELTNRMLLDLPKNFSLLKIEKNRNFFNKDSQYFSHYSTAYQIFKNNKLFGVGLKNFRKFCDQDIYKVEIYKGYEDRNCRTHPHNFYLELLSELGFVGFLILISFFVYVFFKFIITIFKTKNYQLMLICFSLLIYFIPILPRGSFFSNWNAIIFWFIFSFAYSIYFKLKLKND